MKYSLSLVEWIDKYLPPLLDSSVTKREDTIESPESVLTKGIEVTYSKNQGSTTLSQLKIDLDDDSTQSKYQFHLLYLTHRSVMNIDII